MMSSRRASTESIYSIQGKETDFVRDTSDTDTYSSDDDRDLEYEPVTESEQDAAPIDGDSSSQSEEEIISTQVIAVSVRDDGEFAFADGEADESDSCDSEIDLHDYWQCAQCCTQNNNPLYRYCQKCFKVRKNFFPPRPKRKSKRKRIEPKTNDQVAKLTDHTDSGVDSVFNSQELTQEYTLPLPVPKIEYTADIAKSGPSGNINENDHTVNSSNLNINTMGVRRRLRKRRADTIDHNEKRAKTDYTDSDSSSDSFSNNNLAESSIIEVKPLMKTISDPALTIETDPKIKLTKKAIANSLKEKLDTRNDLCIICFTEPKSGVFVHGRIAHICCCYKCSVKVWAKAKRCPVCNCKVSNVLKAVVM